MAHRGQELCHLLHPSVVVSFYCVHGCVCLYDISRLVLSSLLRKKHLMYGTDGFAESEE